MMWDNRLHEVVDHLGTRRDAGSGRSSGSMAGRAHRPACGPTIWHAHRSASATKLTGQDGASFDRSTLQGHWSLVFFGFTHCPGICPMTLTTLAQTRKQLGGLDSDEVPQVVLVSVDPERDTPEQMAKYVAQFDPSFIGVTGSAAAIYEFTAALGIAHKKIGPATDDYMVDHTAAIMMVDPRGRRVAVFSPPFTAEHLAADYLRMLGRG